MKESGANCPHQVQPDGDTLSMPNDLDYCGGTIVEIGVRRLEGVPQP